jgi:hypothetical protein
MRKGLKLSGSRNPKAARTNGNTLSKCVYLQMECLAISLFLCSMGLLGKETLKGKKKKGSTLSVTDLITWWRVVALYSRIAVQVAI